MVVLLYLLARDTSPWGTTPTGFTPTAGPALLQPALGAPGQMHEPLPVAPIIKVLHQLLDLLCCSQFWVPQGRCMSHYSLSKRAAADTCPNVRHPWSLAHFADRLVVLLQPPDARPTAVCLLN